MAKQQKYIDFPFYEYLNLFYQENRKRIRRSYNSLTKRFLDHNDPEIRPEAFLRKPQFEAMEMYVFLKEYLGNRHLYEVFEDWYQKQGLFEGRSNVGINQKTGQVTLFGPVEDNTGEDKELYKQVFKQIKAFQQSYPNFIFALTMGLGKTILMAASIFYEFLLANKYPNDERYCHNALVFAPDKTVLQSLKEIQTFDKSLVVPPQHIDWLETHLKFYFLDNTGDALNAIEHSDFNIIISNTQKIILKRSHKEPTPSELLFKDMDATYKAKSLNEDYADLYGFDIDTDADLITNQRFAKLTRLRQLGIYLDEAHHAFGSTLERDFLSKSATSLRVTINELAEHLKEAGTQVVGCYNYTGTPFVKSRLLPEVVYTYGLKKAIDNRYLKKVRIKGFSNIKKQTKAFVRQAIQEFWATHQGQRYEGMLPKFAFFASTIDELQKELRPAVEEVLAELGIPIHKVLVNVGDDSITSNDDLREFKNLDTPASEKQFILLVNKGKEGWNCRSLFAVALHREPKSKVFVLQATMRCLRAIGEEQFTGQVYLAEENIRILEKELESNFRLSVEELVKAGDEKLSYEIRIVPPPVEVLVTRTQKLFNLREKEPKEGLELGLGQIDYDKYRITVTERNIEDLSRKVRQDEDYTHIKEQRHFSELTLVAEVARYLNIKPSRVRAVLSSSQEGMKAILERVNEHNEILYDWVIPHLFQAFFEVDEYEKKVTEPVRLARPPKKLDKRLSTTTMTGGDTTAAYGARSITVGKVEEDFSIPYKIRSSPELTVRRNDPELASYASKSFHLDTYCFDSQAEREFFLKMLRAESVDKIWFTGMLTHGQSDFLVHYIDPDTHALRSYYPDFLIQKKDGSYLIVEVKADFQVEDAVVLAKQRSAIQMAEASRMEYRIVKATEAGRGIEV